VCATRRMEEQAAAPTDKRQRFPPAISGHAVWRYCRCALRYRDVAELLAARGVLLTDETVRQGCHTFGPVDATTVRRRRPTPGDQWHRDAVFIAINGAPHARWRAVDQDGQVLAILVQARRDKRAATKSRRTLLEGLADVPRVVITDTLARDGAARRDVLPRVEQRRHTGRTNRAEHAHQPTRARERRMRRCKDPGHARRSLAASGPIASHCRPRRHRLTAATSRATSAGRCATWRAVTGTPALACAARLLRRTTPPSASRSPSPTLLDNTFWNAAASPRSTAARFSFGAGPKTRPATRRRSNGHCSISCTAHRQAGFIDRP